MEKDFDEKYDTALKNSINYGKELDVARKKISIFSSVKLCARYSPMLFVMCLALTVMDGLIVPLMVVVVANFIDSAITLAPKDPQTYIVMKNAIFMGLGYFYKF